MIALREKSSRLRLGGRFRSGAREERGLGRLKIRSVLLGGAMAALVAASVAPPAVAVATPARASVEQASWAARKQIVRLSNGVDLAFVEIGDPEGSPVILLHGLSDTGRLWTIVAPYLTRHRLLIIDQRGHGASSKPECCYALADFVFDLKLFMDVKGIGKATVVGSSLGSMVGQLFAAEHPERVQALVLAGSTALAPLDRDQPIWSVLTDRDQPANRNDPFLKEWSPQASPTPVDPLFVRYFDEEMAAVPAHVWRGVVRELTALPVARHSADVRAPVMILSGEKDPLFGPDHHVALTKAYPRATAHVLKGLGHNLVVERPHQVGPLLAAFLAQQEVGGGRSSGDGARPMQSSRSP